MSSQTIHPEKHEHVTVSMLVGFPLMRFWNHADLVLVSVQINFDYRSMYTIGTRHCWHWSRKWDLPLNASKSHHLSIEVYPDDCLVLSEEANVEQMTKCKQINDLGITVNSAFTPSANVLTAANKADLPTPI